MKKIRKSFTLITFFFIAILSFYASGAFGLDAPAWVNDGSGSDIDYTNNNTSYSANWASIDWSGTANGYTVRYNYILEILAGGSDYATKDQGYVSATYPSIPDTNITKTFTLSEGRYRFRVRSEQEGAAGWNYSVYTVSDGFVVDLTGPSASMATLSDQQSSTSFNVSWSATDPDVDTFGSSGSGIANYDVQYRDGSNGSWVDWKTGITSTSATFTGQWRHTYYFRVRATDRAGNRGDWSQPVSTSTDTVPPTASMQSLPQYQSSTNFAVSWTGSDSESGIAYYDLQVKVGNSQWSTLLSRTTLTSYTYSGVNGESYQFRVRAVDRAGNVGSYSSPVGTTVQATGVSLTVAADPSSLTFSPGENSKSVVLSITATGPGSVTLNQLQEVRTNSETGSETLPPESIYQTVASGTTVTITRSIELTDTQRAAILSTSSKSFTLTVNISGVDSFGNPLSSSVVIPVQVTELPPSGLVINDVTVNLPQSPYYVGDTIEDAQVIIDATGTGTVEGQILIDDSTDWTDNPGFSVNVNNQTSFTISGAIPTSTPGDHTLKVEITSPVQFSKEVTYTVSNETPPFPPKKLVLVKDVAELTNLDGTAEVTTSTGPNGYVEYNFTGTATMKLLSLNNTEVKDVTVTNLIVRYDNANPTKAKIRGGTVEKEVEDGYITEFADGTMRIKKVSFTGQISPATDFVKVDATLYWKAINSELVDMGGFIVRAEGVEAKSFNIQESKPKTFDAFGLTFKLHDVDAEPALVFGKDEANDRYYFSMSGSISMKSKKGTSEKDETLTKFKGFSIYSDGDVTGTITITKKFDIIPDMVTLTKIKFQRENDNLKCKIKGTIHDLPAPLNDLPTTEFSIKFDKDGNVESSIVVLKELEKGNKGHKLGSGDSTEWDVGIGKIDITYLGMYIQFDEGTLNKDHSELMIGLDIYLDLKNQDGSEPTPDQKRISFGELNQNEDFTGGIRVNFDGDFTWNPPTNATIISNKKLDLSVITIMIDALSVRSDPFAFAFTGSILFDVDSVSGGINFENLVVGLDGVISNLSDSITGGNLSIMDVVQVDVADVNWSLDEADLTFKENQTQGEGENQSPQTGDKTIRVKNYFQILNASMSIGDGDGNTIMSGGFKEFTLYTQLNGSRSFVLKDANLSISDIELHADIEYSSSLLLFAGSLKMPGPEGDIEAIACGKLGRVDNKTTMGIFIAAAGLSIPVGPGVFLNEVGGGFFLNPIPDDLAMVRKIANFERPELNDSIEDMRPGGADNPGAFALMLLGGLYVSSPDVMSGRALATLTSNYFNLDAEVELTQGMLKGVAYFAIGWNPSYAEGAVDVKLNYVDIITGQGNLDFYAYGADAWGVMGNFNVSLIGSDLANGSVFVGNPGFMLEASVTTGIDLKIVSGSYTISGMFWYYRTPDPDTFGAYGKVSAEGEFLEGLLGAKASLEGALMSVPSFVFYSVGSVSFEVCYVTVYEGSLWISVSAHGFDGGKGRNKQYDGYIEDAKNMADDLKQAKDELEGDLEQAKVELAKLGDEQREAAGLALVERAGITATDIQNRFMADELNNWGSSLPQGLRVVKNRLFGSGQNQLIAKRNQLQAIDSEIQNKLQQINDFQGIVVEELKDYEDLIVGDLPSVRDVGKLKDPFRGMKTKVVKNSEGKNVTITVGFEIDENEAQSQRDKLNNLRDDFAEYQDEFIKQAGVIDGSLQRLDEILFMNEGNLNQLVEMYATTYQSMSQYIDNYIIFQGLNGKFARESLNQINSAVTPQQVEAIMESKARALVNSGHEDILRNWNQSRINLIRELVQAGGMEGYNPPEDLENENDQVRLFVITGRELWWEIPVRGFQASARLSGERRTAAIQVYHRNTEAFNTKWSAASTTIDNVYQKKADLYNLLYEVYDELATYGTGMIGILDTGDACGFGGIAGSGLGFRTRELANSVAAQAQVPKGDVIYPKGPTVGPLRPPVKMNGGGAGKVKAGAGKMYSNRVTTGLSASVESVYSFNRDGAVLAQAGIADFDIAQVKVPKTGVSTAVSGTASAQASAGIRVDVTKRVSKYSRIVQRIIKKDFSVKIPVKWVSVNIYFAAKRSEIAPYIEIPEIKGFSGTVTSSTEYDALLTATVNADHPIGVVEYSYKIVPGEEATAQALSLDKQNNFNYVNPYNIDDRLYAGGAPDAGTENPPMNYQNVGSSSGVATGGLQFAGSMVFYRPWFSMGGISRIKDTFFSDIHNEGDYYLYVKVRGAGGYSIERRAKVNVRYFRPNVDRSPVVSSIDASDRTPPTKPVVEVDSPFTANRHMLYARWSAYDPESGIQRYEYGISEDREAPPSVTGSRSAAVEVSPEASNIEASVSSAVEAVLGEGRESTGQAENFTPDVLPWRNAGGRKEANIRRINLEHGKKYRVWVRATNGVGLKSIGSSIPVLVDTTPPPPAEISVFEQVSLGYYPNSVHFNFTQKADSESGIGHIFFAVGRSKGADDLFNWTEITAKDIKIANLPISEGDEIWLTIETYNGSGIKSKAFRSLRVTYSDTTPPDVTSVVTMPVNYTSKTDSITVGWNSVHDAESGIVKYEYALGTNPISPDVTMWRTAENVEKPVLLLSEEEETGFVKEHSTVKSVKEEGISNKKTSQRGMEYESSSVVATHITRASLTTDFVEEIKNLNLKSGNSYYAFVRITNGKKLSTVAVSKALVVDTSPPNIRINAPEIVNINIKQGLPVSIEMNDDESGVIKYMYAVWRIEETSEINSIKDNQFAFAGYLDMYNTFTIAGAQKKVQPQIKEAPDINIYMEGQQGESQQELPLEKPPVLERGGVQYQIDLLESNPPWARSHWQMITSGAPPKRVSTQILIKDLPYPGLQGDMRYIVRVWAVNGAGVIGVSNSISIKTVSIQPNIETTVPSSAKEKSKNIQIPKY